MPKQNQPKKTWSHIIRNNAYMMKIILKIAPELCFTLPLQSVLYSVINFITEVWMLQYIINGFQSGMDPMHIILMLIGTYAVVFLFHVLCSWYDNLRSPVLYLKLEEYIQKRIFAKNLEVELSCYEDKEFYDRYVKAAGDMLNRVHTVLNNLINLVWQIVNLCMFSFFVITIDPWLLVFVVLPVVVGLTLGKKKNAVWHEFETKRRVEERQRDYTRRTFYLADFAKEMRLTNIYKVMLERFRTSVQNIITYTYKYGWKAAALDYIINECREVLSCMGAMLYAVYQTLVTGNMGYGDCLVVINSIESLIYIVANTGDAFMAFHQNSLYIDTIREYLDYEPKIKDGHMDVPKSGTISMDNVNFRYEGAEKDVLRDINLTIRPGEKIALVGHNGAGKSTLVKMLLRLYDPTSGKVTYAGEDIKSYPLESYRERFAVVFQDVRLFSLSVTDNVLLRRKHEKDETLVNQSLIDAGIMEKIQSFDKRTETVLTREFDEEGQVLSGGEAQKISIARAFARDSSIMLLDEPSSALDPVAEYKMYETLMNACEGKSVVFISHRLSSAVLADRVILLENGQIMEEGTHNELMQKNGRYAEMFRIQAQNYVTEQEV